MGIQRARKLRIQRVSHEFTDRCRNRVRRNYDRMEVAMLGSSIDKGETDRVLRQSIVDTMMHELLAEKVMV